MTFPFPDNEFHRRCPDLLRPIYEFLRLLERHNLVNITMDDKRWR